MRVNEVHEGHIDDTDATATADADEIMWIPSQEY